MPDAGREMSNGRKIEQSQDRAARTSLEATSSPPACQRKSYVHHHPSVGVSPSKPDCEVLVYELLDTQ